MGFALEIYWINVFICYFYESQKISLPIIKPMPKKNNRIKRFLKELKKRKVGQVLLHEVDKKYDNAIELINKVIMRFPKHIISRLLAFFKFALLGEDERALNEITNELASAARWDDIYSLMMAQGYSLINEKDESLKWLSISLNYGIVNEQYLKLYDPLLENVRHDPRFNELLEQAQKKWEDLDINKT